MENKTIHIDGYGCRAIVERQFGLRIHIVKKEKFILFLQKELEKYHVALKVTEGTSHHSGNAQSILVMRYPQEYSANKEREIIETIERIENDVRNAQLMSELVSITKGD